MKEEIIKLPDGATITVDHDAAKEHIPPEVWAAILKHIKKHGVKPTTEQLKVMDGNGGLPMAGPPMPGPNGSGGLPMG